MANQVVNVAVSLLKAPAPIKLQRSGALISQGGTNTSPGTKTFLSQLSSLAVNLASALALTSITWSGGVATATTGSPHGMTTGDQFLTTIAGANQAGYNGTFLGTITGASTFTYQLATEPSGTSPATGTITYTPRNVAELVAMNNTFFAQGNGPGVTVLELGAGEVGAGVTALTNWIAQNPGVFYRYLVPRSWDGNAAFLAFLAGFENNTSLTYFHVTTTLENWPLYAGMKCVVAEIEAPAYGAWSQSTLTALSQTGGAATGSTSASHGISPGQWFQISGVTPSGWNGWWLALPGTGGSSLVFNVPSALGAESVLGVVLASQYASAGVPATEFSHAADFWVALNYNPSSTNQVTPFGLSRLFGVTPFPLQGNASLLATLEAGNVNVVGTASQGGLTDTLLSGGNGMDGNPVNYWYSIDWVQLNVAAAVFVYLYNGSNNPQNPVWYDQNGINGGQSVIARTMATGITGGLVLNPVKMVQLPAEQWVQALDADTYGAYTAINADPFSSYVAENPDDFPAGVYNGWSIDYVPRRGFASVTVNVAVSNFPT